MKNLFIFLYFIIIVPNSFGRCSWLPKDVDTKFLEKNVLIVGKVTEVDGFLYKLLSVFNNDFDYYLYTFKVKRVFGNDFKGKEIKVKIYSTEKFDGNFYFDEGDELALYVPTFKDSYTEIRGGPCLPRHFRLNNAKDREAFDQWVREHY